MSTNPLLDDDEDEGLFQRHRWLLPLIIAAVGGGVYYASTQFKGRPSAPVKAPERLISISLPPPPPPPPPKVEEQEPPKEEMIAQEEVKPDEAKPEPEPAKDEPPPIGTNNVGSGPPDGFGLGAYKGGNGNGSGIGGSGKRGGSKFGWYAGQVQSTIAEALRKHPDTRKASLSLQVRIWPDATGRITRATLASSSGDPVLDNAIRNDILTGLQLKEPPPADMPRPIVLKLSARKPQQVVSR